jgi:hypothetical protein
MILTGRKNGARRKILDRCQRHPEETQQRNIWKKRLIRRL